MRSTRVHRRAYHAALWCAYFLGFTLLHAGCSELVERPDPEVSAIRAQSQRPIEEVMFTNCQEVLAWRAAHAGVFRTKVTAHGWSFEFDSRTPFCTACLENRGARLSDAAFHTRIADLEQSTLLILRATPLNGQAPLEETAVKNAVAQITAGDTISCAFVHREMSANVVPFQTFLVGFDQASIREAERLLLREGLVGNSAPLVLDPNSLAEYIKAVERGLKSDRS